MKRRAGQDGHERRIVVFGYPRLAVAFALSVFLLFRWAHAAPPGPLNVVLIVIDTLGAKHLALYSNGGGVRTPHIECLAKSGTVFSNAFAVSSWTKPSIASIFTSRYPYKHGVIGPNGKIPEQLTTIAEVFKARDYLTAAFTSHIYLSSASGLGQGFGEFKQLNPRRAVHKSITSDKVSEAAIEWLTRQAASNESRKNFFLFLHYFDPHFVYMHHSDFDRTSGYHGRLKPGMPIAALLNERKNLSGDDIAYLSNLYREEIAYTDQQIGRVLEMLDKSGFRERTVVLVTADHGEEFMEHGGLSHIQSLYDELIKIPLIVFFPGAPARVVRAPVSQLDIFPTLAALSKKEDAGEGCDGISLLPILLGQSDGDSSRELYAEVSFVTAKRPAPAPHIVALRSGRYKLIHDISTKRYRLFDLEEDPAESRSIFKSSPDVVERLGPLLRDFEKTQLAALAKGKGAQDTIEISPEELKSLQSLGYL